MWRYFVSVSPVRLEKFVFCLTGPNLTRRASDARGRTRTSDLHLSRPDHISISTIDDVDDRIGDLSGTRDGDGSAMTPDGVLESCDAHTLNCTRFHNFDTRVTSGVGPALYPRYPIERAGRYAGLARVA
jgi:hypothetical protein